MGNIVQKKDTSIETPTMKALTEQQIQIIKTTWEIPNAKPIDSGELILYRYFEKYPENQEKFLAFKNTPLLMLRGTPGFRSHGSKIMNTFACAIDTLDKENGMSEIVKLIQEIGKSHSKRRVTKKSFVELRNVLVETLCEVCSLDTEGQLAWNNLLDIVFHVIFEVLDGKSDN